MPKRHDWTEFDQWYLNLEGPMPRGSLLEFAKRTGIPHNTVSTHAYHLRAQRHEGPDEGERAAPMVEPSRLDTLLAKLPPFDPTWPAATCAAWLNAMRVACGTPPPTPYPLLNDLLARLPADGQWTQAERDRWLAAFIACLDIEIAII